MAQMTVSPFSNPCAQVTLHNMLPVSALVCYNSSQGLSITGIYLAKVKWTHLIWKFIFSFRTGKWKSFLRSSREQMGIGDRAPRGSPVVWCA